MDPVSLGLAITPLCLAAIKGLIILQSRLKTLRHFRKEVAKIQWKIEQQGDCFREEIHRLLLDLLDYEVVNAMMDNEVHPEWHSAKLGGNITAYLADRDSLYRKAVKEWHDTITSLLDKTFSTESPKDAFMIILKKGEYIESINVLKECRAEMKRIRKMSSTLQQHTKMAGGLPLPSGYAIIQDMSLSLHDLLQARTICNVNTHSGHSVKLIMDPAGEGSAYVNLFFEEVFDRGATIERLIRPIYASCKDMAYPCNSNSNCNTHPNRQTLPVPLLGLHINQSSEQEERLQHEDEEEDWTEARVQCEKLISKPCTASPDILPRPLGSLRIKGNKKVVLYRGLQDLRTDCNNLNPTNITSLLDVLKLPVFDVSTDEGRIKLGIVLVKSMLKLHSTPWWPEGETLEQVYMFRESNADISSCLDTLHLSMKSISTSPTTRTTGPAPNHHHEADANSDALAESYQNAMYDHGIRNPTLYGLGVALLQIGLWRHVPWGDHIQVRRKVERLSYLGKGYYEATKKLIYCDFGLAMERLHDPRLQSAIFNHVVGELESVLRAVQLTG